MKHKKAFIEKMAACHQDILQDAIHLINIPSITEDKKSCREALFYLLEKASAAGMKVRWTPQEDCGVIEIGQGQETLGVLTHVDVVKAGDVDKWNTPPFQGHFDGKWMIGRGAMDDKGPTVVMFHLLKLLHENQVPLHKKIQLIIGTQEEGEWTDMVHYREHFSPPDYGFTPDGAFPVHNIEKGYADVVVSFPLDTPVPGAQITHLSSGDSANTIPSQGTFSMRLSSGEEAAKVHSLMEGAKDRVRASLDRHTVKVQVEGKSSHSSLPENGDSALTRLVQTLWKIHQVERLLPEKWVNALAFSLLMTDDVHGNALGFENQQQKLKDQWIGNNIVVPTILRMEKDHLVININVRHKVGVTRQHLEAIFKGLSDRYGCVFKIDNYSDPLYVNKEETFFQFMHQAYEEVTGQKSTFALAGGTSYAKALPRMVSWGPVFPGEADSCHQENEKIELASLMKAANIYGNFLYTIATSEKSFNTRMKPSSE